MGRGCIDGGSVTVAREIIGAERRKVLGDSDVMSADTVDFVAYCFECGSYGEG